MQELKIIGKPLLGEKYVEGRKKERKKKKKNNAKFSGHYVCPRTHNVHAHALRLTEITNKRKRNKKKERRIMPSLVATMSALARTMCMRMHSVHTNC